LGDLVLRTNILRKKHITYLNIALGAVLLFLVFMFIKDIASSKRERPDKGTSPATAVSTNQRRMLLEEYSPIMKNNPFGFPGGEIRPLSSSSGTDALQTNTDITLIGTVVGPKQLSYAIFQDSTGMQEIFKVGEPVLGLGTLSGVKTDRVRISDGEMTHELLLADIAEEVSKASQGNSPVTTSSFARKIGKGMYIVDQRKVQEAIENPTQMMTDARLRPHIRNGREEGFLLSEVKMGGIYHSLGLRNGDVLLRINEYDISNPEIALQAFTALRGMDRIQIDLLRAGSKMTMTYQIK
jgi:general secretion pathway protein C